MKNSIVFCFLLAQIAWSYGESQGVSSYSYSDSKGNRYGGTLIHKNGQVVHEIKDGKPITHNAEVKPSSEESNPGPNPGVPFLNHEITSFGLGANNFAPNYGQNMNQNWIPDFFSNLESTLNEVFQSNFQNQKLAFDATRKAFDMSWNRMGFGNFGGFGNRFGNGQNSAFALAASGPGFKHQVANIQPANPNAQNIDLLSRMSDSADGKPHFNMVSASSRSSSTNINGKQESHRSAESVVNRDGVITKYKVSS